MGPGFVQLNTMLSVEVMGNLVNTKVLSVLRQEPFLKSSEELGKIFSQYHCYDSTITKESKG